MLVEGGGWGVVERQETPGCSWLPIRWRLLEAIGRLSDRLQERLMEDLPDVELVELEEAEGEEEALEEDTEEAQGAEVADDEELEGEQEDEQGDDRALDDSVDTEVLEALEESVEDEGESLGESAGEGEALEDSATEKEAEREMTALRVEMTVAIDAACVELERVFSERLLAQSARLTACAQQLQLTIETCREVVAEGKRKRNEVQTQLQREQEERLEERQWLAQLWPEGTLLPTLLLPLRKAAKAQQSASKSNEADTQEVALVKEVEDETERERVQALVTRRVERERVRQQLEEASHWKVVLSEDAADGEQQTVYYMNTFTEVSVWDPPAAMLFEPPPGWDLVAMDWDDNYNVENVTSDVKAPASSMEGGASGDEAAASDQEEEPLTMHEDDDNDDDDGEGEGEDEEEEEEDLVASDPVPVRERMEQELQRSVQLKAEVEESVVRQRSLAMELLTATRASFEREQQQLEEEDAIVIVEERKRRVEERQEQAAAQAKVEARRKKQAAGKAGGPSVQPTFSRDSMAKKSMMLAADDRAFEQELREFARERRAERLYLAMPATRDSRARSRHQLEPEYVHMKQVESRILQTEQLEFNLLEKSALRHEEASAKADELRELCVQIRQQQHEVELELPSVEAAIPRLEAAEAAPPEVPRPSEEQLARAAERFLVVEPLTSDEEDQDEAEGNSEDVATLSVGDQKAVDEGEQPTEAVAEPSLPDASLLAAAVVETNEQGADASSNEEEDARVKEDEAELRELKTFTDAERAWREWEKAETTRITELVSLRSRRVELLTSQKRLAVDLALFEDGDAPFFERLRDLEHEVNTRLWSQQAQAQVERARFVVERAAREESVFQLRDRVKELQQQQEDARCLPLQALHPLDRVQLTAQAQKLTMELQQQAAGLQTRYAKEEEAKMRLMQLETRACDYAEARLQEETKLFTEKQTLWDLNFTLADDLQSCRRSIERLYLLMQEEGGDGGQETKPEDVESSDLESKGDGAAEEEQQAAAPPRKLYEESARVFETKLQYLQQMRQFLITCYDREDRWRALAGVALVKDVTSDDWMNVMQRGRHEDSLALLQTQHDEQQQVLQRQINLLSKVRVALQAQIEDLNSKMRRLQSDYQSASESVRLQTQEVIEALRAEVEAQKGIVHSEQLRFKRESERCLSEHEVVREVLEKRVQDLDDVNVTQTHWLTAAKRELLAQRVANEELLKAYQSLEKRRASETNDMRFRISAQIKKISNIEMWNLSLKISAKEAHVELVKVQEAMAEQEQQHKQLQRRLRLQNWRHRVAAQAILTDVDLLFAFFADGIAIVSGATAEANDALRENAGIEVLAALARHSSRQPIRAICARALGQLAWNSNATTRSLGWQAKRKWFRWMTTQSEVVLHGLEATNTAFDAVAGEEVTETNWLADPSAPTDDISGECDQDLSAKGGKMKAKKLLFTATWQQFDDKVFPDTNVANQQHMGLSANVLQTILDLCRSPETDRQVQRNALLSLALIVRSSRNTAVIGRMDGSIALLVELMTPKADSSSLQEPDDPHVVRHSVQALGNLAFRNTFNQQVIYAQGAIPLLLHHCDRTLNSSDALDADVDLTLASTQALAHLTHEHVPSCQAIVESQGIAILTRLCNSPRIRDAIDLEVYELIQTYAAQVIANVITLLDRDDNDSDLRAQHIADLVLEQEARGFPGYSSGVDKAGSDRDPRNQELSDEAKLSFSKHTGVATFVLMCASCNRDVAFHGAIVLGSIAQHDAIRAAIGAASGMDALFLLADRSEDLPMMAQATWALANLTWNRENQYRVARYLDHLYQLCTLNATATARVSLNQQELEEIPQEEQDNDEVVAGNAVLEAQRKQQDAQLIQQIREHALCILANSLFYNEANRQLVASHANWMQLLTRNCLDAEDVTLEHSARALCSLSYSDSIALQMGAMTAVERPNTSTSGRTGRASTPVTTPMNGLHVFIRLCARAGPVAVQQHGLFGVINMCLHDANKSRMLEIPHGIDTLVNLSGHTNPELCEPALEALELLADLRQLKQDHGVSSSQSFASVDMKKLITLLSDATSPSVVAMISDAIADEVWKKPSSQVRLRNEHGLEKLLELCVKQSPLFPAAMVGSSPPVAAEMERRVLISCLWALRNTVANNVRNQDLVGALGGVQQLIGVFDRQRQHEEVVEALLAALVALVMKHSRNSQQLVQFGLDMLIGLADETEESERLEEEERGGRGQKRGVTLPPLTPSSRMTPSSARNPELMRTKYAVEDGGKLLENATLARELLHLVAPFNTREDAATAPPSPNAKVRRVQELHASVSPVQRR